MKSNFDYLNNLSKEFEELHRRCTTAETYQQIAPNISAWASRQALEWLVHLVYKCKDEFYNKAEIRKIKLFELVSNEKFKQFINSDDILIKIDHIRRIGNWAVHGNDVKKKQSLFALKSLYYLCGDILISLGYLDDFPNKFDAELIPKQTTTKAQITDEDTTLPDTIIIKRSKNKTLKNTSPNDLDEQQTRKLYIDLSLQEAGWQIAEQENLKVEGKAGIEIEIDGIPKVQNPTGKGYADYVLFDTNGKPLAVVEAKRTSKDPIIGKEQAKTYAQCLKKMYGLNYDIICYYTNGYEIWVIDGQYPERKVWGFHTLQDLQSMIRRERKKINIEINNNIVNRDYQKRAVTSVCEWFNKKHRRSLLVMATGTGKTRVSIALVDVLLKNQWIKRVLFLADRRALVDQAYSSYTNLLPNETKCNLCYSMQKNYDARLIFSTYQTMIGLIDTEQKEFSVGHFDLIIIDEAHRSIFGKYGAIFEYFDSLIVGLTATPREDIERSTFDFMNLEDREPTDNYAYETAVAEGYLVNYTNRICHSYIINEGIKYDNLSEEDREQLDEKNLRDVNKSKINRSVFNKKTINKVLQTLMQEGLKVDDGQTIGKTIIFALNHEHACKIVEYFNNLYPELGTGYCDLIDYQISYKEKLLDNFKQKNRNPRIAVSVDMLNTGIDVPEILNLVFFKPVYSKINFWQMIGRGTRLCKNLLGYGKDKKEFLIFDWCGNFKFFKEHPEGREPTETISLIAYAFIKRANILSILQRKEFQEKECFEKNYSNELLDILLNDVKNLGRKRILVRKNLKIVDKYSNKNNWIPLDEGKLNELEKIIAPLFINNQDVRQLKLDCILLRTELLRLQNEIPNTDKLEQICSYLLNNKLSIPQVSQRKELLEKYCEQTFWSEAGTEDLETSRKVLRELMQFIDFEHNQSIEINIEDIFGEDKEPIILTTPYSYKKSLEEYLDKNENSEIIRKIKNIEQLKEEDIKELERICWQEIGKKEDYDKYIRDENKTCGDNVAVLIRSLCGVNKDVAKKKFKQFIQQTELTTDQEKYLESILDYVCKQGDMESQNLMEEPWTNLDWETVFGDKDQQIGAYVEELHKVITITAA